MLFLIILCVFIPNASVQDIRLLTPADTYTPNAGRVQVYTDEWRDVCHDGDNRGDNDWSITEAMVACRQLGYPGTALSRKDGYGNGDSKAMDNFDCDGNETALSECDSSGTERNGCNNNNDAGVICTIPGYIGCYIDDDNRVLPNETVNKGDMTVKNCIDFCSSSKSQMRYAGVQYSTHCFCGVEGSHYDRLGKKWDNECDMTCGGNGYEICGGTWRMSIYDLQLGKCTDPSPPHGSTVEQDFSFGSWVTFECDPYYELVQETTLQCVLGETPDDCKWKGEPPECNFTGCLKDWKKFGRYCYIIPDKKYKYDGAVADCLALDSNITSIQTEEENIFLTSLADQIGESVWIGFDDIHSEGNFTWVDGSNVTYTNWNENEPNNVNNEDCTELYPDNGFWNDLDCNDFKRRYICKSRKAVPPSPKSTTITPAITTMTTVKESITTEPNKMRSTEASKAPTAITTMTTVKESITTEPNKMRSTEASKAPNTKTMTTQSYSTNTFAAGTPDPRNGDLTTGAIVGVALASVFALLLLILLAILFLIKPRHKNKQNKLTKPPPIAFDGPYDLTIDGTQSQHTSSNEQPAYSNTSTINYASDEQHLYGNTQTNSRKEKHPVYANTNHADPAFSDIYHEVPESSTDEDYITVYADVDSNGNDSFKKGPNKVISVVYSKAQKGLHQHKDTDNLQEGSLYYARSDSIPNSTATKQAQDSTEDNDEGWEENVAYSCFQDNDVENKEVDDNDREGWEDNAIYCVDDTGCSNDTTDEWVDNTIYAGSDDKN